MSRSAADATRFTATGPYVSSKAPYQLPESLKSNKQSTTSPTSPSSVSYTSPNNQNASSSPSGETPREKVERLRAQARAARLAQNGNAFDRIIEKGRRVANSAHKVMIYTLITASGVCGALTLYSVVSLTMWNRRQRELWLDRQLQDLQAAREAYVKGTATPEQLEILRNEKIGEIEKQKRKEADEQKLWNRAKRFLFDGLKKEDVSDASVSTASGAGTTAAVSELINNKTASEQQTTSFGILEAVNAKKAESAQKHAASTQQPGSLDVLAMNAETTAKQSVKSWTSWIWGR
ncbi:conserved hypothetical protein [Talaromyces stipitatus ATCC 10500]|uniref:Cytochrome oxidase c assembly-domain-containing protein n=1 Tax=Talaromyces stipitatus (strain ATCC 10500 / CBS 375.48 / QM 6759 / NRRL 1006) TaxID=441959 RepID=B8LZC0_TALSN|nr:uncharacterized protein TSTA_089090 [Talaromyces stipitatus ATCC 10500]EED21673.1 conserved hypothetical protein [Talaromyces stipitatus ATCC 10500]